MRNAMLSRMGLAGWLTALAAAALCAPSPSFGADRVVLGEEFTATT